VGRCIIVVIVVYFVNVARTDGLRRPYNRGSVVFRSGNTIPHKYPNILIIASGEAAAFISTTFLVPFSSFFPKSTMVLCLHPAHNKNWYFLLKLLHIVDLSLAVDVTKCARDRPEGKQEH
jgi:hypothetical protein